MTKKSTSGTPLRRLGGPRQEKGRLVLGARGKASDAVRAQILKNTQGAKPAEPDDVGHIVMVEGQRNVQAVGVSFAGGGPAEIASDLLGIGISRAVEGGKHDDTTYGKIPRLWGGKLDISFVKGAGEGFENVPLDHLTGVLHAIWDQPASFLGHRHPSSTISVELGEHEIVNELPATFGLTEPVERRFNLDLHSLEGVDTRGRAYPGNDEPAALPDWPAELSAAPYKMK